MQKPTIQLTQDQIDFFHREGYLVLEQLTTPEELEKLRAIYDELFNDRIGWDSGDQFDLAGTDDEGKPLTSPQVLGPAKYKPELLNTLHRANVASIIKQLFADGEVKDNIGEHMIYKPPHIGSATPWHQDQAYHSPRHRYRNVNIWMPLDDVTVDSGCMQFIPKSHKFDVLPHQSINNDPRIHGLELVEPEKYCQNPVACPVPAGGATLHHSYTLHYAAPNTSDRPRRAYITSGGCVPVKRETPLKFPWLESKQTARLDRKAAVTEAN